MNQAEQWSGAAHPGASGHENPLAHIRLITPEEPDMYATLTRLEPAPRRALWLKPAVSLAVVLLLGTLLFARHSQSQQWTLASTEVLIEGSVLTLREREDSQTAMRRIMEPGFTPPGSAPGEAPEEQAVEVHLHAWAQEHGLSLTEPDADVRIAWENIRRYAPREYGQVIDNGYQIILPGRAQAWADKLAERIGRLPGASVPQVRHEQIYADLTDRQLMLRQLPVVLNGRQRSFPVDFDPAVAAQLDALLWPYSQSRELSGLPSFHYLDDDAADLRVLGLAAIVRVDKQPGKPLRIDNAVPPDFEPEGRYQGTQLPIGAVESDYRPELALRVRDPNEPPPARQGEMQAREYWLLPRDYLLEHGAEGLGAVRRADTVRLVREARRVVEDWIRRNPEYAPEPDSIGRVHFYVMGFGDAALHMTVALRESNAADMEALAAELARIPGMPEPETLDMSARNTTGDGIYVVVNVDRSRGLEVRGVLEKLELWPTVQDYGNGQLRLPAEDWPAARELAQKLEDAGITGAALIFWPSAHSAQLKPPTSIMRMNQGLLLHVQLDEMVQKLNELGVPDVRKILPPTIDSYMVAAMVRQLEVADEAERVVLTAQWEQDAKAAHSQEDQSKPR